MNRCFDSHCHLYSLAYPPHAVSEAKALGIAGIVTSAEDEQTSRQCLELARSFPGFVHATVGVSPQGVVKGMESFDEGLVDGAVGVGEVGLDYKWADTEEKKKRQKLVFSRFISLSLERGLPIVVHSRQAETDCIRMLEDACCENVLLHCFSGSSELAKQAADSGWFISIPPQSSSSRKKLLKTYPLELLLTESDAPGIGRGPQSILTSAELISKEKQLPLEDVLSATYLNAKRFFKV